MKMTNQRVPLALLFALAPVLVLACYADRGVLVVGTDGGAGTGGFLAGAAGTTGAGGFLAGAAGITGAAGTTGTAGGSGGKSSFEGCDITPIITAHNCTIQGACHDSNGSAAGLDLASPGLGARLYNGYPGLGGAVGLESICRSAGIPYIVPDSYPARGLFLMKLTADPPCGAQMPSIGSPLNATELDCIQRWAQKVVVDHSLL
jgi:hypothetical protein